MHILVIGGSGFVSGTLTRTALNAGHTVDVVTRGQRPLPESAHSIVADRKDTKSFADAIAAAYEKQESPWDMVVDCIGYEAADARQDIELFRERARHLVFVSTDFVYDPRRRQFPQPADNHHYLADGYGGNKRLCELEFLHGDTGDMAWTVVRPCHIYGPGSQLGCLPEHGRDPELIAHLRSGEPLRLVGGGYFLQQPILAADLAELILSCAANDRSHGQIYQTAGPDIVESRAYYQIIADILGVEMKVEEVPVDAYLAEKPESAPFLCHRIYDLSRLHADGLRAPSTPIEAGLRQHVAALLDT